MTDMENNKRMRLLPAQNMVELAQLIDVANISKFQVTIKANKVSVGCRKGSRQYGASATNLTDALCSLK